MCQVSQCFSWCITKICSLLSSPRCHLINPGGESFAGWQQGSGTEPGAGGSHCQVASQEKGGGEDGRGECQVGSKMNEKEWWLLTFCLFEMVSILSGTGFVLTFLPLLMHKISYIACWGPYLGYQGSILGPNLIKGSLFLRLTLVNFSGLRDRRGRSGRKLQPLQPAMKLSSVWWVSTWQGESDVQLCSIWF